MDFLASVYLDEKKYTEAQQLYQKSLAIKEATLGGSHPKVATTLFGLAEISRQLNETSASIPLYERALAIQEKKLGPTHPDVLKIVKSLLLAQEKLGNTTEIEALQKRVNNTN